MRGRQRCHRHAHSSGESNVSEIIQGECGLWEKKGGSGQNPKGIPFKNKHEKIPPKEMSMNE